MRVLIVGRKTSELHIDEHCAALGVALVDAGHSLVGLSDVRGSAEEAVFRPVVNRARFTVFSKESTPSLLTEVPVERLRWTTIVDHDRRIETAVESCDVVVLVGGRRTTDDTFLYASMKRPIVALEQFGGAAAKHAPEAREDLVARGVSETLLSSLSSFAPAHLASAVLRVLDALSTAREARDVKQEQTGPSSGEASDASGVSHAASPAPSPEPRPSGPTPAESPLEPSASVPATNTAQVSGAAKRSSPRFERPHVDNDLPTAGRDLLSTRDDAERFARLLAAEDVTPPIAVGLFGKWGSGKSHFMRQMRDSIVHLETSGTDGVVKGIVQVEFNAWHYHDTNLWASLALCIFDESPQSSALARSGALRSDARRARSLPASACRGRALDPRRVGRSHARLL